MPQRRLHQTYWFRLRRLRRRQALRLASIQDHRETPVTYAAIFATINSFRPAFPAMRMALATPFSGEMRPRNATYF
jgi:hypothetical protein